jgi:signal peptidase II
VSRSYLIGLPIALFVFVADQASKHWILERLAGAPWQEQYYYVAPFLNFALTMNHGVTFGMFDHGGGAANVVIFGGIALAVAIGLLFWLRKVDRALVAVGVGLIIGGALGNFLDRVRYGAVVDFIDAHWGNLHWYVFNLADSAIDTGVALLLVDSLLRRDKSPT